MKKILIYTVVGVLLLLGVIGFIMPGIPALPFLLAAALILSKSSKRDLVRLLRSPVIGTMLRTTLRRRKKKRQQLH